MSILNEPLITWLHARRPVSLVRMMTGTFIGLLNNDTADSAQKKLLNSHQILLPARSRRVWSGHVTTLATSVTHSNTKGQAVIIDASHHWTLWCCISMRQITLVLLQWHFTCSHFSM